jgi:MFS family permease
LLGEGIAAAKSNPRIGLAYCCAFASRADLLVVGTYLSLWVVQAGAEQGLSTADSMIRYGMLFGLIQGTAMVWSIVMGIICDRFDRLLVIAIAFGLASAAYFTMGSMTNPFGSTIIYACVFLGMGEISTIISGGALIGQEAPIKMRGSVLGIFGLCGAVGLLSASFVGGQVFDYFSPTAPFTMMSIVNGIVCVLAVVFYRKTAKP